MSEFILVFSSVVLLFALYLFFHNRSPKNIYIPANRTIYPYPRNNLFFEEHEHRHRHPRHHHNYEENDSKPEEEYSIILNNTIIRENIKALKRNDSRCRCRECEERLKTKLRVKHINEDVERYKRELGLKSVMW